MLLGGGLPLTRLRQADLRDSDAAAYRQSCAGRGVSQKTWYDTLGIYEVGREFESARISKGQQEQSQLKCTCCTYITVTCYGRNFVHGWDRISGKFSQILIDPPCNFQTLFPSL